MTRTFHPTTLVAALLATCAMAMPVAAQQDQQQFQQDQQQFQQDQQQFQQDQQQFQQDQQRQRGRQPQMQGRRQMQRDQQRRQQGPQFALQPEGWVRVAIDYDQDERIDAVETIYYYDLVQARQRSAQRRREQGRQGQQDQFTRSQQRGQQRAQPGRQGQQGQFARSQQGQRQQMRRISGQISDLRTIRLAGGDQQRIARIETQQGQTIPVLLGSTEQISQLNLQGGDQITVWATRARLNDRPVLCARRVQAGDQRVTVSPLRDRNLKRVRGQIVSTRTTRFRGRDQQFQVAEVELNSGRTEQVILGPQNRLQNLNLQQGDQVRLLVRPGRLNNESALVAEQIHANERTVQIPRPEGQRFSSRQQDRTSSRQQQDREQ